MVLDGQLLNRVIVFQVLLIVAGLAGFALWLGRLGVMSFAVGATIASAGFWVLYRVAGAVTGLKTGPMTFVLMATRLLLTGVVLYVILRTYEVDLAAVACGVLTPVAAITLASLYEFFYARTP